MGVTTLSGSALTDLEKNIVKSFTENTYKYLVTDKGEVAWYSDDSDVTTISQEVFMIKTVREAALRTKLELANQRIRELEKLLNETLPKLIESIGNGKDVPTND